MAKKISHSLKTIHEDVDMINILDNSTSIHDWVYSVDDYWKYDLVSRSPSKAQFNEGILTKPSNLDMATFLYSLVDRGAVITIPEYNSKWGSTVRPGEVILSDKNRSGKILGLTAHSKAFSFGVNINDQNVIQGEKVGSPRTFLLTDYDGNWYKGLSNINFIPSVAENKFLTENKLWDKDTMVFRNFINPEKWVSFYGKYYFITKVALDRLKKQKKFVSEEIKSFHKNGIFLGSGWSANETIYKTSTHKEHRLPVKVACFVVEADIPAPTSEFTPYTRNKEGLKRCYEDKDTISKYINRFKFSTRMVELAVSRMGMHHFPAWLEDVKWEDYKKKGKKIIWKKLKLSQIRPFEESLGLRYRWFTKSVK